MVTYGISQNKKHCYLEDMYWDSHHSVSISCRVYVQMKSEKWKQSDAVLYKLGYWGGENGKELNLPFPSIATTINKVRVNGLAVILPVRYARKLRCSVSFIRLSATQGQLLVHID